MPASMSHDPFLFDFDITKALLTLQDAVIELDSVSIGQPTKNIYKVKESPFNFLHDGKNYGLIQKSGGRCSCGAAAGQKLMAVNSGTGFVIPKSEDDYLEIWKTYLEDEYWDNLIKTNFQKIPSKSVSLGTRSGYNYFDALKSSDEYGYRFGTGGKNFMVRSSGYSLLGPKVGLNYLNAWRTATNTGYWNETNESQLKGLNNGNKPLAQCSYSSINTSRRTAMRDGFKNGPADNAVKAVASGSISLGQKMGYNYFNAMREEPPFGIQTSENYQKVFNNGSFSLGRQVGSNYLEALNNDVDNGHEYETISYKKNDSKISSMKKSVGNFFGKIFGKKENNENNGRPGNNFTKNSSREGPTGFF